MLPAPDAEPASFRLLAYTCAGGPDDLYAALHFGFYCHLVGAGITLQLVGDGDAGGELIAGDDEQRRGGGEDEIAFDDRVAFADADRSG